MSDCSSVQVFRPGAPDAAPVAPQPDLSPVASTAAVASSIDDGIAVALAETFRMLGDATRVRILDALFRSELCVQAIARRVDLSESAVSHQLRLLRSARIVRPRRAGRQVFYALDDQHVAKLFAQGLEHVREARAPRLPTAADGARLG
ncbi:MAG: ArsR/SmtB family transcription factor [Vicinamibacterales bacterium]